MSILTASGGLGGPPHAAPVALEHGNAEGNMAA